MKRLIATLVAASVAMLAIVLPATASAETFEVDTLESEANGSLACIEVSLECSLRDAIERANVTTELDVIDFSELFAGTIELDEPLPPVLWPVEIDATTAADYSDAGHPVIVLDGSAIATPEPRGLELGEDSGGSRVEGLSIGGFRLGVFIYGKAAPSHVCGNYIGVLPDGETALPNEYAGITTGTVAKGVRIGAECAEGNLISGNGEFGILEAGTETRIANNRIGLDAEGDPLPNGDLLAVSAGIFVNPAATKPFIGASGLDEGNVIAENLGDGIRQYNSSSAASIRGNSIYANALQGISVIEGTPAAVPKLETVYADGGQTEVLGTIGGAPNEHYEVDVFANKACDSGGTGEGETYLGEATANTGATGVGNVSGSGLDPAPAGSEYFTLTATAAASGATSTFSNCVVPSARPAPPPDPPKPPIQPIAQAQLVPENGESLAVEPLSGVIYIKLPGSAKQVKLTEGMLIPVGSVVDASKGKVTLTSVNKAGEAQTAVFYGGKFLVAQRDGSGLVTLKLRGGNFKSCGKAGPSTATASAGRKGRRLWGSGKGKFRTEGNYGSATVRGTVWLTEDRCSGTFFKVRKGVVTVRDFSGNQTFSLSKGKSYLAQP